MTRESYHFKLGAFDCLAINDGYRDYPLQNFFATVPRTHIEAALNRHKLPLDYISTPHTSLYINTGSGQLLIGMGAGNSASTIGQLGQTLQTAGVAPGSVDAVIITHAHPHQIGGALDKAGKPVYTTARHFIWREEWAFWTSEVAFSKAPARFIALARKNIASLQDQLTLLDREGEVMPGIGIIAAPGHTPGHIVVSISSAGEQLLYTSDTVLSPLHLEHPNWRPIYDIWPEQAAVSKRDIFDRAAVEKALVMGHHFPPFPGLGYVRKQAEGWQWQPLEMTV